MNETNRSNEEDSRYVTFRRSDFSEPAKVRITTRPPKRSGTITITLESVGRAKPIVHASLRTDFVIDGCL